MSYGSMQHSLFLAHGVAIVESRALILFILRLQPLLTQDLAALRYSLHLTSRWGKRGSGRKAGRLLQAMPRSECLTPSTFCCLGTQTALKAEI